MRRRELLRGVLLALGIDPTRVAGAQAPPSPTASRADRLLSDAERGTLLSFAEALVAGRAFSSQERAELLKHIEEHAQADDTVVGVYRDTATLLDRLAGGRFSSLGILERSDLVARHHLAPARRRPNPPDASAHSARTRVAPDLIGAYYRSSVGWAVVGYGVFPGRCGELLRYTRPEP